MNKEIEIGVQLKECVETSRCMIMCRDAKQLFMREIRYERQN